MNRTCIVPDCQALSKARGLCPKHYRRWRLDNRDLVGSVSSFPVKPSKAIFSVIGSNIEKLRLKHKLHTEELARRAGVSTFTVRSLMNGHREGHLRSLYAIAAAFNVEAWELLKPGHFDHVD